MSFTNVTLTGTVGLGIVSSAGSGVLVNMTLSSYITDGTTVVAQKTITATCDSNGNFSLTVPANDDSTTTPTGTYYSVTVVSATGGTVYDSFEVVVSHTDAPTATLYGLPRLNSTTGTAITYGVSSFNGRTGAVLPLYTDYEFSAQAVATSNETLSGLPTIDGYVTAANDTVLLSAQTTASENGPWVVASGAWSRPSWFPTGAQILGTKVGINGGTSYANTIWSLSATTKITVDTTSQTWVQLVVTSVLQNPMSTEGDIIYGTGSGTPARLGAGTDNYVLTTQGTAAAPSWQKGLLAANDLSDVADEGTSRYNLKVPMASAQAVATSNVTLSSPGGTFDGYSAVTGDVLLLTGQTTSSENGLWTWNGATLALTRPTNFPSGGVINGMKVGINAGTTYADQIWSLDVAAASITIDTNNQTWVAVSLPSTSGAASGDVLTYSGGGISWLYPDPFTTYSNTSNFTVGTGGSLYTGSTSGLTATLPASPVQNDQCQVINLGSGGSLTLAPNASQTLARSGVTENATIPPNSWLVVTYDSSNSTWYEVMRGSLNTLSSVFISSNVVVTTATTVNVTSLSLAPGRWLVTGQVLGGTNASGSVEILLGPTSASTTSAYVIASILTGSVSGNQMDTFSAEVTLATTTTIYLILVNPSGMTTTIYATNGGVGNLSGIIALPLP